MTASKFFLLFVFLLHGAYLFFITVPRYNLTSMVPLLIFAGAGTASLIKLLKANKGVTSVLSIVLASCFVIVIGRLPFVNVAATLFGAEQASTGLVIGRILATLSLLGVATALLTAISAYEHPKGGATPRGTLLARLSVVALTIVLLPMFLLPANASGRWYEWQAPIFNGSAVTQTFTLPVGFSQETSGRQLYLMVDADSAWQLADVTVSVDGTRLNAPIIPALSLGHEFDRFQSTGQGQMREAEWVYQNLTQAAGIGAADLRQWFIYPIPAELLTGKTSLKVQLTSAPSSYANLYGAYATSPTSVQVPSLTMSSWEKAFYGVECDHGLSDTRFNTRLKSLAATAYDSDLSSEPGVQSGRYNIHLLAGPPVEYVPVNLVVNPATVNGYQTLLLRQLPVQSLTDAERQSTLLEADLPPYAKNELWVVRVSGDVRHDGGNARLAVVVKSAGQDRTKDYGSPWTSHEPINGDWRHFDSSVPVEPQALPSPPQALNIQFWVQPTASSNGAAQFRNVNLEIGRLPVNPLRAGYVIY